MPAFAREPRAARPVELLPVASRLGARYLLKLQRRWQLWKRRAETLETLEAPLPKEIVLARHDARLASCEIPSVL